LIDLLQITLCQEVLPLHFLVECATGYALFLAHGINDIDMKKYQPAEEYINQSDTPFELKAYLPFSSFDDALIQMNDVSNCKLISLSKNYPTQTKFYFVSFCSKCDRQVNKVHPE
jgi:hypothetical protein